MCIPAAAQMEEAATMKLQTELKKQATTMAREAYVEIVAAKCLLRAAQSSTETMARMREPRRQGRLLLQLGLHHCECRRRPIPKCQPRRELISCCGGLGRLLSAFSGCPIQTRLQ